MVRRGVGRIPEDRHAVGLIGDMSITENMIAERYRERPFSKHHLIDWPAARSVADGIIAGFDVRCPGPQAIARLLSGGISEALITTAAGLCVAIPSYIAYRYLRGRVDHIVLQMERDVVRFADALNDRVENGPESA